MYLDAKNLYGWAMTHDFCWLNPQEVRTINVHSIPLDVTSVYMYVFEVNLKYRVKLHDYHSDYPLAPESFQIKPEMLSTYERTFGLTQNERKHFYHVSVQSL